MFKLENPKEGQFDAVTLVAGTAKMDGGFAILLFWDAGELVGGRSVSAGPWHDLCCRIFQRLCPNCPGAFNQCLLGTDDPCHAFDHCCWLAWLLAHVFHI